MADSQPTPGRAGVWSIALDGGTTNTRARLLHGPRIVATSRRAVGVRDTVLGDTAPPGPRVAASPTAAGATGQPHRDRLVRAVREAVEEVALARISTPETAGGGEADGAGVGAEFLVAAGMLSSEVGLVAVPHVPAPRGSTSWRGAWPS